MEMKYDYLEDMDEKKIWAEKKVDKIMQKIKSNLDSKIKNKSDADEFKKVLFDNTNSESLKSLYNALSTYYQNNFALFSNFNSMWKKYSQLANKIKIDNKQQSSQATQAAYLMIFASGNKKYSKVKKGMIPKIRLTNYEEVCEHILRSESLESPLKQGKILEKNDRLEDMLKKREIKFKPSDMSDLENMLKKRRIKFKPSDIPDQLLPNDQK